MVFKAPENDKSRTIALPAALCSVLRWHRATQSEEHRFLWDSYKDQELVFARAEGSAADPWIFGRAVLDCIKRAKVTPIALHGSRDAHASLCARQVYHFEVVSNRLGHALIGVTASRYLNVYPDRDAEAASAFNRLVG